MNAVFPSNDSEEPPASTDASGDAALLHAGAHVSDILAFTSSSIVGSNARQQITFVNRGAEHLFGYTAQELINQPIEVILPNLSAHPPDTASPMNALRQVTGVRKDGTFFVASVEIARSSTADGYRQTLLVHTPMPPAPVAESPTPQANPPPAMGNQAKATELAHAAHPNQTAEALAQAQTARLQVLADASRIFAEVGTDLAAVLDRIAQTITKRLHCACVIRLPSNDGRVLHSVAMDDMSDEMRLFLRDVFAAKPIPVDDINHTAVVFRTGKPLISLQVDLERLRSSFPPTIWPLLDRYQISSLIVMPLCVHTETIGVLTLVRHEPYLQRFEDDDVRMTQDLADRAALAISTAQLFERAQRDLAERAIVEAALRESEERLLIVTETAQVGLVIVDQEHRYRYANRAYAAMFHLPTAQIVGRRVADVLAPVYETQIRPRLKRAFSGEQVSYELVVPPARAGAAESHYTVTYEPGNYRSVPVVVVVVVDITERKRAEQALRQSDARFAAAFQANPAAMSITRLSDGCFIDINTSHERLFGYRREELIGLHVNDIGMYADPTQRAEVVRIMREQGRLRYSELTLRTKSGELRQVLCSLEALELDGEACILGSVFDITDRKLAEAALEQERALLAERVAERTASLSIANAELARAVRLKDEFLASMSHELRTPLNSVLGRSEILQEGIYGPLTHKQREAITGIEESGRHLLSLINDILDLSKIEADKLELDQAPVAVQPLMAASLQLVAQAAAQKHIQIASSADSRVLSISADERRLKQILVNLLSNAVKFTPQGGRIGLELTGDPARETATFRVWDTGIGISQEDLPKLFKPFVQIDSSLSRQYEGTGLGLALVLRLAQAHGGSVAVDSTPGQGSRFSVTIPWQPSADQAAANNADVVIAHTSARVVRKALVIEDMPVVANQVARYLQELGAQTTILLHGRDAVAQASALQPELIVLDIVLPDTSGWEVLQALKAEPRTREIPVVILSVVDEPERGRALGAAAYLVKPIDRAALAATIQRVLQRPTSSPSQAPQAPQAAEPARPRILLAEDNQANIDAVLDYLRLKGFDVVVARNGLEALERAQEQPPEIILMDVQMPVMDGLEATRRIRADARLQHVPIIALTALAMPGDRERCLQAGADDYLTKPVSLRTLLATIEAHQKQRV